MILISFAVAPISLVCITVLMGSDNQKITTPKSKHQYSTFFSSFNSKKSHSWNWKEFCEYFQMAVWCTLIPSLSIFLLFLFIFFLKVLYFFSGSWKIKNRIISTELEPVLSQTEKSCIASYYKQLFTNIKIKS